MVNSFPILQPRSRPHPRRLKIHLIAVIFAIGSLATLYYYSSQSVSFQGKSPDAYAYDGKKWESIMPQISKKAQPGSGIPNGLDSVLKVAADSLPVEFKKEPKLKEAMPDGAKESLVSEDIFPAKADLNINSVYDKLFPNKTLNSEAIESGEKATREVKTWSEGNKLKVFVVLHSHNDAGWGSTFEQYFTQRTYYILNNILKHLSNDSSLKFIWCETSFFSRWWKGLPTEERAAVKKIVQSKQLEFVAGGWVMPDEANVHYISYLTQLIEGHQFLQQHLNATAKNGWAIDPFGLSSSLSFLQTRAGIKTSVFSRIHYSLNAFLRKEKSTEFLWRQQWDEHGSNDVFSYLMPYGTYDYRETCGDKIACTFFDTNLIPTNQLNSSATRILEALRKKSQLFNTNNLLYPIGGDFRWGSSQEWSQGAVNLKNVMEYINSQKNLHTDIKFATLDEYFTSVSSEIKGGFFKPKTFIGDFFTYSDKPLDYWSGYYTSRVFHKATERQLMSSLRTAQLLFTMMTAEFSNLWGASSLKFIQPLVPIIVQSRRELSIFQHHDGITGTSRDHVMEDYSKRMNSAIEGCQEVAMNSILVLGNLGAFNRTTNPDDVLLNKTPALKLFQPSLHKNKDIKSIWRSFIIQMEQSSDGKSGNKTVSVFNPLETLHKKLIKIGVSHPHVKVFNNEIQVCSEIFPVFSLKWNNSTNTSDTMEVKTDSFELYFEAELKPLELRHYKIVPVSSDLPRPSPAKVQVFNVKFNYMPKLKHCFEFSNNPNETTSSSSKDIALSNTYLMLNFTQNGTAESISLRYRDSVQTHRFKLSFKHYTSTKGLYSFFPEGKAKTIEPKDPIIVVVQGKLQSYVAVWYQNVTLRHKVTLHCGGIDEYALDISNTIDIRKQMDYELVMHMATDIKSEDTFYTDSNGFQMMRRKQRSTLPIQGNFYPVASSAFIEDSKLRMTILAGQPGGGASLRSGELEIMQDRINSYDDDHGIGQGGKDNLETVSNYKIMFESPSHKADPEAVPLLSLPAHHQLRNLLHPVPAYVQSDETAARYNFTRYSPSIKNYILPCDIGLVLSHPLPLYKDTNSPNDTSTFVHIGPKTGLIFNRVGYDKRFCNEPLRNICCLNNLGSLNVHKLFGDMFENLRRSGVSFVQEMEEVEMRKNFNLKPMDVYGFTAMYKKIGTDADAWEHSILLNVTS